MAHHLIKARKRPALHLGITVLLGVYFLGLQVMEYYEATFTISDSVYGSTFYLITGFHGIHVALGAAFLLSQLLRSHLISNSHHVGLLFAI